MKRKGTLLCSALYMLAYAIAATVSFVNGHASLVPVYVGITLVAALHLAIELHDDEPPHDHNTKEGSALHRRDV